MKHLYPLFVKLEHATLERCLISAQRLLKDPSIRHDQLRVTVLYPGEEYNMPVVRVTVVDKPKPPCEVEMWLVKRRVGGSYIRS